MVFYVHECSLRELISSHFVCQLEFLEVNIMSGVYCDDTLNSQNGTQGYKIFLFMIHPMFELSE